MDLLVLDLKDISQRLIIELNKIIYNIFENLLELEEYDNTLKHLVMKCILDKFIYLSLNSGDSLDNIFQTLTSDVIQTMHDKYNTILSESGDIFNINKFYNLYIDTNRLIKHELKAYIGNLKPYIFYHDLDNAESFYIVSEVETTVAKGVTDATVYIKVYKKLHNIRHI